VLDVGKNEELKEEKTFSKQQYWGIYRKDISSMKKKKVKKSKITPLRKTVYFMRLSCVIFYINLI
jgi:hypothetical protein